MAITPMQAGALKPMVDRTGRGPPEVPIHPRAPAELLRSRGDDRDAPSRMGCRPGSGVFRLLCADDGVGMERYKQLHVHEHVRRRRQADRRRP